MTPAAALLASGVTIGDWIVISLVILLIAVAAAIVLGVLMLRSPGLRPASTQRIKEAAAADVAAIEEDDTAVSPDAPGRQEDDL